MGGIAEDLQPFEDNERQPLVQAQSSSNDDVEGATRRDDGYRYSKMDVSELHALRAPEECAALLLADSVEKVGFPKLPEH